MPAMFWIAVALIVAVVVFLAIGACGGAALGDRMQEEERKWWT